MGFGGGQSYSPAEALPLLASSRLRSLALGHRGSWGEFINQYLTHVNQKKSCIEFFGKRIVLYREAVGWKTKDLSIKTGIAANKLSQIETGKTKNPGVDVLAKIIQNTDVSPLWLLTGQGPMRRGPTLLSIDGNVVVPLDSHQVLVQRFKNRQAAERINEELLRIEELEPDQLEDILMDLEIRRERLSRKKTPLNPPRRKARGGDPP